MQRSIFSFETDFAVWVKARAAGWRRRNRTVPRRSQRAVRFAIANGFGPRLRGPQRLLLAGL